jgi:hypothetical protein
MKAHAITFLVATVVIGTLGYFIGKAAVAAVKSDRDRHPDAEWLKTL